MVPSSRKIASTAVSSPTRMIRRTEKWAESFDPAAEHRNIVIEIGSIFRPVCSASRPMTSCR